MKGLSKFQSRRWIRVARWAGLAAALPALWACTARKLEEPAPAPNRSFVGTFQQTLNRDIDIVFMVDNSFSMKPLQDKLTQNFPAFMNVLKALPLPNVHIAVVSSDLGAGKYNTTDGVPCVHGGDQGKFQAAAKGTTCATGSLKAGQTYISNINGNANYNGDIADAFSCIAALGQNGCGFEHVFGSVLRSLGADGHGGAPPENAGFLRPEAWLAVILITNEDDCSAPLESALFDPNSKYVSDPLGPLTSYRCNLVGHTCDGAPPPKGAGGPFNNCVSNEDGTLLRVADVVNGLKGLKSDPSKILVAAIAGPPKPYVVTNDMMPTNDDPAGVWPQVGHSCTQGDGTYADPGVRVWQWVQAFAGNGVFESICNNSFTPALQRIGEEIGKKIGSQCVDGQILTSDQKAVWTGANGTPDCTVTEHAYSASGDRIDTTIPPCAGAPAGTYCWQLDAGNAMTCTGQHILVFPNKRDPNATVSHIDNTVACSVKVCPPAGTPNPPPYCP
jgi:hypothetical protein